MKVLKIAIDKPIINNGADLSHIATSWQVSKLPDFSLRHHYLDVSLNDTVDLLTHKVNLPIEKDDSVYIRTKYHFTNSKNEKLESNWSDIVPLQGDQVGIKMSGVVVVTPSVKVNIDYTNTERGEIVIETSKFRLFSGVGSHFATDWYIYDINGTQVYKRENDEDNLLSIRLDTSVLSSDTAYIVKVKHSTDTNTKSNFGRALLTTHTSQVKIFDLDVPFSIVPKRWLYGALKLYSTKFLSIDLIIKDGLGVVKAKELSQTTRTPRIYTGDLTPFNRYTLAARVTLTDGTKTDYIDIKTDIITENTMLNYGDDYPYLNKFNFTQEFLLNGLTVQNSMEHQTGDILLGNHNSNNLFRYKYINNKLINTGDYIDIGVGDDLLGKPYINVLPLLNGDFIVDYASGDNNSVYKTPIFKYLRYNTITSKFKIIKEVRRSDELYGTAPTSSAAITNNAIYYIPNRHKQANNFQLELKKLDIETFTITTAALLPVVISYNATLIRKTDDELILIGGCDSVNIVDNIEVGVRTNNEIYKYTISTDTWVKIGELPNTLNSALYAFQGYLRRDKNIELFNAVNSGDMLGNQSTLTINMTDDIGKVTYNPNDYSDDAIYRNLIMLQNGDMLRISTRANDPQKIYTFVSNTYKDVDIIDNTTIDIIKDLVVPKGKTITIESPYRFDTIKIDGTSLTDTGLLRWVDGDIVHEFRYNDLIITRPTKETVDLYKGAKVWNSITILDGASLDTTNILIVPDNKNFTISTPVNIDKITIGKNATLTITY